MSTENSENLGTNTAADPKAMRASYFGNVFESIKHIKASGATEGRKPRGSDYLSIILLPVVAVILCLTCFSVAAVEPFKAIFVCLLNLVILYFIGARIGIIRSLNHRQAHLVWVLIMATFMLGCTFSLFMFELGHLM